MLRSRSTLLLAFALVFAACDSGPQSECPDTGDCLPPPARVLVGNQGNFSEGDGSVTAYDPQTDAATELIADLGTIIQSIADGVRHLYVASNTAGRVDVYAYGTEGGLGGERVAQIAVENPRYLAFTEDKVYVTSQLYDRPSQVAVVDRATFEVTKTVAVGGLAEGIAVSEGRVFVATGAFGAAQVVDVLDAATDEVVQRIDVGCVSPRSLAVDGDGEVWVFCAGAPAQGETPEVEGEVVVLDAATGEIVARVDVDGRIETAGPGQDVYGPVAGALFAVRDADAVLRFDTEGNRLVDVLPTVGAPIGAVAFDPFADRIYLGRVPGFDRAGSVTIHDRNGQQVGAFAAGVAPTSILLRP